MADERLNDQPIAKDGAYVYAEDASGNQIKISKADLATVVAGVMYSENLYPFMDKNSSVGIYGTLKDFNNAVSSGYFQVSGIDDTILNAPVGVYGYGNMIVCVNGRYITQIFYPRSKEGVMAFRSCQDSLWFNWKIFE